MPSPFLRHLLARNLRHLKAEAGLTWDETARKLKVSPRAVYHWRDGDSMPSGENLQRIAKLFDVSVGYLLEDNRETRRA